MRPSDQFQTAGPNARAGVQPTIPQQKVHCERCEGRLNLGIFFDGTNNNRDRDLPTSAHSNVARLYAAYPYDLELGYGRLYVPGVGTPYEDVDDSGVLIDSVGGNGCAAMGERRILYALLSVFNAVDSWLGARKSVTDSFFNKDQLLALCRNSERANNDNGDCTNISRKDLSFLGDDKLKMAEKGGLLHDWPGRNKFRHEFFKAQIDRMLERIGKSSTPKLVEITIDVFGFSRGAAQARVFCNWLYTLVEDGKLFGVPFSIRFLGIFDTVASVGVQGGAFGYTTGHMAWADPDAPGGGLKIHPSIKRVEHYIAMHENRASFPLDRVYTSPTQVLPPNVREWAFPGMHSDVGGGYAPKEQGKRPNDSEKISQIALEHMYIAARTASVPLDKTRVMRPPESGGEGGDGFDSFEVAPSMRQAFGAFMMAMGQAPRTTQDWLLPYLAWQYKHLNDYQRLTFYLSATPKEKQAIDKAQKGFAADIAHLEGNTKHAWWELAAPIYFLSKEAYAKSMKALKLTLLDKEALELVKHYGGLTLMLESFFSDYVHDSYAGFDVLTLQEFTGRLHWRRIFYGTEKAYVAMNHEPPSQDKKYA
jgi:hypothetical protein